MKIIQRRWFVPLFLFLLALVFVGRAFVEGNTFRHGADKEQGRTFHYGLRREIVNGQLHLVAMTKQDFIDALIRYKGLSPTEAQFQAQTPYCSMPTSFGCKSENGCKKCHMEQNGTYTYCLCDD